MSPLRKPATWALPFLAVLRVEEGAYEQGYFKVLRIGNGDPTDWGLHFTSAPQVVRVRLGTYEPGEHE